MFWGGPVSCMLRGAYSCAMSSLLRHSPLTPKDLIRFFEVLIFYLCHEGTDSLPRRACLISTLEEPIPFSRWPLHLRPRGSWFSSRGAYFTIVLDGTDPFLQRADFPLPLEELISSSWHSWSWGSWFPPRDSRLIFALEVLVPHSPLRSWFPCGKWFPPRAFSSFEKLIPSSRCLFHLRS